MKKEWNFHSFLLSHTPFRQKQLFLWYNKIYDRINVSIMQSSALYLYVFSSFVYRGQLGKISKSKCRQCYQNSFFDFVAEYCLGLYD